MPWKVLKIHDFFDLERKGYLQILWRMVLKQQYTTLWGFQQQEATTTEKWDWKTCKPLQEPACLRLLFNSFSGVHSYIESTFWFHEVSIWYRMKIDQSKSLCVYPCKVCWIQNMEKSTSIHILASSFPAVWKNIPTELSQPPIKHFRFFFESSILLPRKKKASIPCILRNSFT